MQKVIFFWSELKATFWFVPILIILSAFILAGGLVYLDTQVIFQREGITRYLFVESADSARSILTTISGAMIGVAGTVFSLTLVALTLASSQYGPRLIKNFMSDRLVQVVLGSYVATFIYCLLILNTISEKDGHMLMPTFSVLAALVAALVNIILLVFFIHRIAVSIQADHVISDLSKTLSENIKVVFPERMGDPSEEEQDEDIETILSGYSAKTEIKAQESGYIQYIAGQRLISLVKEKNGLLELHFRPGDYIVKGVTLLTLYSTEEIDEEDLRPYGDQFILGVTRTNQQDAEKSIHQMVEMASRALSPGINDPYTAITCIDNLTTAMSYLATVKFPSKYRYDEDQVLRVITDAVTYEGMLEASFNQIRQFSRGIPSVVIRMMEGLTTINQFAKHDEHRRAIKKHATMLRNLAEETFTEKNDLEDLKRRSRKILGEESI